jgi:hypothetical protein
MSTAVRIGFVASLALCMASTVLFALSLVVNPWDHYLSLADDFHIGLWNGQIVFFNNADYGPYRGSIIGFVDEHGNVYPPLKREVAWGYSLGVCFRYFRWIDDSTLWTLIVSLLWPIGVFGFPCLLMAWIRWRRRRVTNLARHDSN